MGGRGSGGGKVGGGKINNRENLNDKQTKNIVNQTYKKTDKINYINKYGGSDIQEWESYSAKDIDKMFKQVQKGKKLKKLGYTWVVDYNS